MVWGLVAYQDTFDELFGAHLSKLTPRARAALPCSLYLSGWGKLVYEEVRQVSLHLASTVSDLEGNTHLLQIEGKEATLKRLIQLDPNIDEDNPGDPVYSMNVCLEQPAGDLYWNVLAHGAVSLECDVDSFIPFELYRQDPKQFGFDRYRERQAGHFSTTSAEPR